MIIKKAVTGSKNHNRNLEKPHYLFLIIFIFVSLIIFGFSTSHAADISAKAAVLVDTTSGSVLYSKNPDLKLPPASTTKLVTAMVALDVLNPDRLVTVSSRAADTPSVEPRLTAGRTMRVKDLLYLALMRSINGSAVALAEASAGSEKAFVVMMNNKVESLGASSTKYINATGLPGKKQFTTARNLAGILRESLKYPLISDIVNTRLKVLDVDSKPVLLKNTNYLLWTDDDQIGGKTGYTRAAHHCVVSASRKGDRTLIVALLGEPVRDYLWLDAKRLLDKGSEILNINDSNEKNFRITDSAPKRI
ncbi:MAG: D-alanyl-D-alanine carboxypeptidase [Nitrospirae bacterium]|nr:D-alanyl-D-alanine carboxypeptidase [Nitrospirota bacterium]